MGGEGNGGGDLRHFEVEERAPRRPRTRRHVGFSPPWSIRLIRRYPAPILERAILALGIGAVIGQSVAIAWLLR